MKMVGNGGIFAGWGEGALVFLYTAAF